MASSGNPITPGGGPFDMQALFNPSSPQNPALIAPQTANPNPQIFPTSNTSANPNLVPYPLPSASYPPPTGGGPYPFTPQNASPYHFQPVYQPYPNQEFANVHPQRSLSIPAPTLQPQMQQIPSSSHHYNLQNLPNPQNPNHGAQLMAMLNGQPAALVEGSQQLAPHINPTSSTGSDFAVPQNLHMTPSGGLTGAHQGAMMRMQSSKLPKGRHLIGDHLVYDIDDRFPGEMQPQLEVTPITKYGSDPGLVVGRQIAVNKTYICYGLKLGAVRVLNINTALRSLLKGLAQRVTDMAFFAEDVHLLASASIDGRVYVWKITEGPDEEDKPQITGNVVIAIQITGEGEDVHPRVCWHCHKQEVLVVGIGKRVLKIDTTRVGKRERFSAEEPLQCPIDKLIDGIQLVGSHDGEITDLSMCQWMTTRLVSASVDGTIKIWEDRNSQPIAVLRPHDGHPVNSATFLAAPHRPDHIILITGGPLNREMKIWVSAGEEGWLLPSDAESWNCTQTLQLKSLESRFEDAFFNQVMALSQAGLLVLANAKRNAIYAIHFDYGPNPAATRMDYLAEFTVTMPILSLTGTSVPLPHGEQTIQMYCVQTQAIQQYALDLSRCLPPSIENAVLQKSDSSVSLGAASERLPNVEPPAGKPMEIFTSTSAPKASVNENSLGNKASGSPIQDSSSTGSKLVPLSTAAKESDVSSVTSPPLQSPRVARTLSGFRSPLSSFGSGLSVNDNNSEPNIVEYSVDRQVDAIHGNLSDTVSLDDSAKNDDNRISQDDISMGLNSPIKFKHPTHLVTPSEILMANSTSDIHVNDSKSEGEPSIQDVAVRNDTRNAVVDLQVVDETRFSQNSSKETPEEVPASLPESKEKSFYSQASDLGMDMAQEFRSLSPETYVVEDVRQFDVNGVSDKYAEPSTVEEVHDSATVLPGKIIESTPVAQQQSTPNAKGKKQRGKSNHGTGPSLASASVPYNEPGISSNTPVEHAFSQLSSMQEMLNQLVTNQAKEGKRLEAAIGRNIERAVKANSDALWARIQEEIARKEKLVKEQAAKDQAQLLANIMNAIKEQAQQLSNMMNTHLNKDIPSVIERTFKKESVAVGQSIARTITPTLDKTVTTSITENFLKGVGDKAVNQLEKSCISRLDGTVARQVQIQFQTSVKQVLQESLKLNFEASVIPAFEKSCRAMFEQVDATFQKGLSEHTSAAQISALKQLDGSLLPTAVALRDAINSASSMTQTLSSELLDGQRKLLALVAGANSQAANPLISQLSNGPLGALHEKVEVPLDPTKELSRLVAERKYEEAFTSALQRSDVGIVSWLCYQIDLPGLLSMNPLPLSQGVLLSLLQQLACDISTETSRKLTWMREVVSAINPTDPMIVVHVRPIFEQVYQILNHHRNLPTTSGAELSTIRLITHVLNSMLMGSK